MCDEEKLARWVKDGLNRREFGALGGMAALAACAPTGSADGETPDATMTLPAMAERDVSFPTADGTLDGVFITPATTPVPGIV